MNTRIDDRGTPTHLQDPNFTRSTTPPVEKPLTPTDARQGEKGKAGFHGARGRSSSGDGRVGCRRMVWSSD